MAFWSKKQKEEPAPSKSPEPTPPPTTSKPETTGPQAAQSAKPAPKTVTLQNISLTRRPNTDVAGATTQSPQPTDSANRQPALSTNLLLSLGKITSVLMRSRQVANMRLSELEALVTPALRLGQFLVAEVRAGSDGSATPEAVAIWAMVSDEVDKRLSDPAQPVRLAPDEWRSGDIAWLVVIGGSNRTISPMLQQLQTTKLKGKRLKTRIKGKDGKVSAIELDKAKDTSLPVMP